MSDSQKPPREVWVLDPICNNTTAQNYVWTYNPAWIRPEQKVHLVEYSAYDQLMQQAQKMRETLEFYANYKQVNISVTEVDGSSWATLSSEFDAGKKAEQALEQFDEFIGKDESEARNEKI